jgi:hypothetical protein
MVTRSPLVQMMLDSVKQQGNYYEDVPKRWMRADFGMERALLAYVEQLEALQVELQKVLRTMKRRAKKAS